MMLFANLFKNCCEAEEGPEPIDWTAEDLVESTLKRESLLVQLQALEDSDTPQAVEAALDAINASVTEDEAIYLKFLNQAGTLTIIQQKVLDRRDDMSPLVAAPLLQKFAKHDIGTTPILLNTTATIPTTKTQLLSSKINTIPSRRLFMRPSRRACLRPAR